MWFLLSSIEESATDLCCVISSLVQVMMDSYSRTKSGFQSLIQKEWVIGGHGFLDRCNHLHKSDKEEVWVFFLLFSILFKHLCRRRRDLDVSPQLPVNLRIFNFVLLYVLVFCTVSLFLHFRVQQCLYN